MSSFCVFGMTALVARAIAEEEIGWTVPGENFSRPRQISREERAALVDKRAAELFEKRAVRQISPAFDAPQFAHEWLDIARRSTRVRGGCVMVRGPKINAKGAPVISKITGLPVTTWLPYPTEARHA
ncbi:hypothetical protein [Pigmentiphaga kullae]|uniref:Uncharacterized protein n=1 Tax=Pigmentiphaga kullae TaxID=151784 RepID=A0A4Q7NCE1_9BURK|nr:hypothetical protein [Pigmentiphaga kullae]RZS80615.1 hypothetical protein EV675_3227 [Pigmentiphaga kullae]